MDNQENYQWCHICFGQTIYENDTCTQCGNHLHVTENNIGSEVTIAVADKKSSQMLSYYRISKN